MQHTHTRFCEPFLYIENKTLVNLTPKQKVASKWLLIRNGIEHWFEAYLVDSIHNS